MEAKDSRAKLSQATEGQREAAKKVKDGETREQALRMQLQESHNRLEALGGGVKACSHMLDQSEVSNF